MSRRTSAARAVHARRATAAATLTALSIAGIGCGPRIELPAHPHPIVILDIDTLRADHLGCYGYPRDTSPNLDAFAASAVRFDWAFAQAPNTPPSQSSIVTGLYPTTHGMVLDDDRLPDEVTTLAEAVAGAGYTTAAFVDGGYMSADFNLDQGFDLYDDNKGRGLERIGPKAIRWLHDHAAHNFLLLVHTYDVHSPYDPPEPFRSRYLEGLEPPTPGFEPTVEQLEAIRTSVWTDHPRSLPPRDLEYAKSRYDGGIRYVDDWIGRFLAELTALGLDERATVVVLSDHGEEFGEHGSVLHEKLYATVTRIPLLIRVPGEREGLVVPSIVESIDLMPTLLDLAGVTHPPGLQGASMVRLIRGKRPAEPPVAFGESPYFGIRRFVAYGDHRLITTRNPDRSELYDFRRDPKEQRDLQAEQPERVKRLARVLADWEARLARRPSAAITRDEEPMSDETRRQLEALGYLQ